MHLFELCGTFEGGRARVQAQRRADRHGGAAQRRRPGAAAPPARSPARPAPPPHCMRPAVRSPPPSTPPAMRLQRRPAGRRPAAPGRPSPAPAAASAPWCQCPAHHTSCSTSCCNPPHSFNAAGMTVQGIAARAAELVGEAKPTLTAQQGTCSPNTASSTGRAPSASPLCCAAPLAATTGAGPRWARFCSCRQGRGLLGRCKCVLGAERQPAASSPAQAASQTVCCWVGVLVPDGGASWGADPTV